ncbi:MAG: PQQ-binding-like beta-propeller repeat protein [Luteitalea sp.]|nr:PQQ-binding-like beta-propeller repeat protein [Luteitalea sp.]
MRKKIVKAGALAIIALVIIGAALYAFGLRIALHGSGRPYLTFVPSEGAQAARIARHRESQRAEHDAGVVPAPAATEVAYWTDFRGPNRDGHYRERPILTSWPDRGLQPVWKQPVGGGYASFAIAGGRAFTIEQRGAEEVVAAYDVTTGRELWTNSWTAAFRERMGGDGPRATPTWAEGHVYALGATGELRCLDEADGRVVWRTNILRDAGADNLPWGMAASPLVVDGTVIVLPGGTRGQSVVAYDRRTGRRRWSALDDQQAYSSPMLVTLAGVRQMLVFSASRLMGLSPDNGDMLWEYPWKTQFDVNASQPIVIGGNRVFVSTGYGTGAAVIEIGGEEAGFAIREVWRNIRMKNQFTSSVLHDGFIYGLDEAILACVDAETGELMWKGGRYGYGQVLLADGHVIVLTEDGDLALVRATPARHEEIVRFPVLDGKTWNHPAMADGYLLVRNLAEMAAFDLRPPRG